LVVSTHSRALRDAIEQYCVSPDSFVLTADQFQLLSTFWAHFQPFSPIFTYF
jgi:hypothetical protein